MNKMMAGFLLLVVFVIGAVVGIGISGAWHQRSEIRRQIGDHNVVDVAFIATREAEWLAMLRLNKTNEAINSLENALSIALETLAAWNEIAPPSEMVRKSRDGWLVTAKAYRKCYPSVGYDAEIINAFLNAIPNPSPSNMCSSNVTYLIEHYVQTNASIVPANH